MLQAAPRELARGPDETQGQLAGNDPLFQGLDAELGAPVHAAGRRPVWMPTGRGPALEGAGRSQGQAPRLKRTISWPYRNEGLPSGRSARAARITRRRRSRYNPVRAAVT